MAKVFPFTAIVGQRRMKQALILNAVNPRIGGVLIRGERGTAKSTASRALAALLPEIQVFADSPYNDDPNDPDNWSDWAKEQNASGADMPVENRRIAIVDLPVSATEDRVVGTLDIERAIQKGERHFDPGVLAAANRGMIYIDEVNLLDDHVVDLLLDSAAMGRNVIEREGISFTHPARFILIGTMNPEEGDLRPQLLDRFALSATVAGLKEADDRVTVMQRNLAFEADPHKFYEEAGAAERELGEQIVAAREVLPNVHYTPGDLRTIATLTTSMGVDGHRGDLVILRTAMANAALNGRTRINHHDILMAAELALPHRIKRGPMQSGDVTMEEIAEKVADAAEASDEGDMQDSEQQDPTSGESNPVKKKKK